MTRIWAWYGRPDLHLAEGATTGDGAVVAGAGTALTPPVVRSLLALGIVAVAVREADRAQPWEVVRPVPEALAALDARFAREPPTPLLDAVQEAIRRRLLAGGGAA